jgi:Fic family protein
MGISLMSWNWQQPAWPTFTWDAARLVQAERLFAENAGLVVGAGRHLEDTDQEALTIEIMCLEAVDTSAIEGEVLDRDSVRRTPPIRTGRGGDCRNDGGALPQSDRAA